MSGTAGHRDRVAAPFPEPSGEFPLLIAVAASAAERVRIAELVDGTAPLLMVGSLDELRRIIAADQDLLSAGARPEPPAPDPDGGLIIDTARSVARWGAREVSLSRLELDLLASLSTRPLRVWSYRELHDSVWRDPGRHGTADVQSLVKRLRRKLRRLGTTVGIDAVRGTGFRLADRRPPAVVNPPARRSS
jgi:Transcriptional regulatory protein, C terminal